MKENHMVSFFKRILYFYKQIGEYTSKRDSAFCGLCWANRKDNVIVEDPQRAKGGTISVCAIF